MAECARVEVRQKLRYTGRRMLFDALALIDVGGMVASEAAVITRALPGFFYYAAGTIGLYIAFWLVLRRHEYPVWASLLLQAAVVGHMAGRFVQVDGNQLYQFVFFGIHTDKVIHLLNTCAGAVFVLVLFRIVDLRLRGWEGFVVAMVAAGLGTVIEIIEFASTYVLATHNVGDYVNNAQDLVANLAGAVLGWAIARRVLGPQSAVDDGSASSLSPKSSGLGPVVPEAE